jgi:predicted MFS family arabinose efflux permease
MSKRQAGIERFKAGLPDGFWFLWLGTIVNRLGGFVLPFLSLYLTSQRGVPVARAGLIVALFGAGSFAAQLVGGDLADRLGRRPVLLMSLFGAAPLTLALGLSHNLVLTAALTALLGFFMDLYRPAVNAAVTDLVPAESRPRAFGYMYWAINLGAALAPVIAGLMAHIDYVLLFAGDAVTTLIYGLIVLARVRETQPPEAGHAARVPVRERLAQLGKEPVLLAFSFLALLFGLIYTQGIVTLPLDMQNHGLGPSAYGLAAAANGILIVLVTIQLSRLIVTWRPFAAMALSALALGAGFGMNIWAATLPAYVIAVVVWTVGEIIGAAVAPTIIANLAPVERRGLYQGVFGSAWGLSFFIGPIVGTWVFDRFSPDVLWIGCGALGVVLAAGYLLLARAGHRRLEAGTAA